MKFKPLAIILLLIVVAVAVYFVFLGTKNQEKKIKALENEIEFLKEEQVPIRYKIISQENDEIEVSVKFYDLDGKEIAKERFKMPGTVASFDFYVVKMANKYIAFPTKIFTDKIEPKNGTSLYSFYENEGFPMIFYSESSGKLFNEGIKALYEKLKSGDLENIENIFGNMVQNAPQTIANGVEGTVFKIVVHTKGGIELIEE
ncbi:MAG: hypothetical protein JXL97_14770 [Bacteroidales bacterium]|nr:hypothetical protein [Bacteroidales bacterium]